MKLFFCLSLCVCFSPLTFAEEITFTSKDGYVLNGTFENVAQSKKAALFIHGTGNLDRNETLPPSLSLDNKPVELFKTLANELSSLGVSSLRYDKRGFKEIQTPLATSAWQSTTYENLYADAEAAVSFLVSQGFSSIVIIGHSEGTNYAIDLSINSGNKKYISSLILIGTVGRSMLESYYYQTVTRSLTQVFSQLDPSHRGYITEDDVPASAKATLPVSALDTDKDGKLTPAELLAALDQQFSFFVNTVMADKTNQVMNGFPSLWWQHVFTAKTNIELAPQVDVPVVIMHGMKDPQVTYQEDALPLYNALKAAGKDVTLKAYPDYGHGLSPNRANGSATLGPIQPDALEDFRSLFK